MLLGLLALCLYLCVDLLLLRDEIICVFLRLEGVLTGDRDENYVDWLTFFFAAISFWTWFTDLARFEAS